MKNLLKSSHGSVRPYTRHGAACHHTSPDAHDCHCPKWVYLFNATTKKKTRQSLNTPSWAQALERATDALNALNPEIAEARKVTEKKKAAAISVAEAGQLWLDRTEREFGKDGAFPQYKSLVRMMERWANRQRVETVQDIAPLMLEKWHSSKDWTHLAVTTRKQRWGVLRSIFRFLKDRGVLETNPAIGIRAVQIEVDFVQGPYTEEQVQAIFAAIGVHDLHATPAADRKDWQERMRAFLTLLLHSGCDLIDAVKFSPTQITDVSVRGEVVPVFRYKRQKTGVQAVIPLTTEIAVLLRSVSQSDTSVADQPFRSKDIDLLSDVHKWSRRIAGVLKTAGVGHVVLPGLDEKGDIRTKEANAKQFRHTFAVNQLVAGHDPERVARMMGHVNADMVRRHYAPWVPQLDLAHVADVLEVRNKPVPATIS